LAEAGRRVASLERRIAALAFPALIVLAAEPLYLLFDIAVVGRLGALSLAGLAIGGLIVSLVGSQLTFLSTATTARSARFYGVGNRAAAVAEGVQATWLAIGLGVAVVAADRAHVVEVLDAAERLVAGRPEIELLSARRDLRRSDD
jgi:Na+-driven multidrug efflux pump